jgi:uncharacterized protein (TIGR00730 family)
MAAKQLGRLMAEQDVTLIYGGGRVGLMGILADAVLEMGGRAIGVIPKILYRKEVAHQDLTELRVVDSMSERKSVIGELSDAFIALPGGIGTLDEIFEVWTWTQLGLQHKYSGLLNVGGYFDPLIEFVDRAVREGFLSAQNREVLLVETDAARLLTRLAVDPSHERQALSGD